MKHGIRMLVTPIPVRLPLPLRGAIPIDIRAMALIPIHMPGTLFMLVEIVIVLVMPIVHVVPIIVVIIAVVILGQQVAGREQRRTQGQYQQHSFHVVFNPPIYRFDPRINSRFHQEKLRSHNVKGVTNITPSAAVLPPGW